MKGVFAAALEIQEFLSCAGAKFCFIGGVALQRWGQPRLTQDVDLTLLCGLGEEAIAIDWLLAKFAARLPDARDFALQRHRMLDSTLVFNELEPLVTLRETPEMLDRLRRLRQG